MPVHKLVNWLIGWKEGVRGKGRCGNGGEVEEGGKERGGRKEGRREVLPHTHSIFKLAPSGVARICCEEGQS